MLINNVYNLSDLEDELKYLDGYVYVSHDELTFPCEVTWINEGFGHARIVRTSEGASSSSPRG